VISLRWEKVHCDTRPEIGPAAALADTVVSVTLRLAWDRAGSGEPLLLVHGIGTTHADFAALRPGLDAQYDVLAPDLPGHASSPPLSARPTIAAIADALEADLDTLGLGRVHVLGSSIGARIALELAIRGRARSVVAIAPSGLGLPPERAYQGAVMSTARVLMRTIRPVIDLAARFAMGRALLLTNLRAAPWLSSEAEARALGEGFADAPDFWQQLWWAVLADVPLGLEKIECPVILAQGTIDVMSTAQTLRYLTLVPGSRFRPLLGGHAPQSDAPRAILALVREATAAA
jgi:pimeloyl-ACP methyl ester carboxylesterase